MDDRALIYRWLAGLFAEEIETDCLHAYGTAAGQEFLAGIATHDELAQLSEALRWLAAPPKHVPERAMKLAAVYGQLFLGAGGPRVAPPYQSAYTSQRGTLFQEPMAEMNTILDELDLAVAGPMNEPTDHLAVQFNVMAELASRTSDPKAEAGVWREKQIDFIDGHLLSWLGRFEAACQAFDPSAFYALAATSSLAFVENHRRNLQASNVVPFTSNSQEITGRSMAPGTAFTPFC